MPQESVTVLNHMGEGGCHSSILSPNSSKLGLSDHQGSA